MLDFLLRGLSLGFAAGSQPGPLQAFLISLSISQGWRRTIIATFAPVVSDGPIVLLVLFLLDQLPDWFTGVINLIGGIFLLYLAWGAYRKWRDFDPTIQINNSKSHQSLLKASLTNLLSPGPYLFWSLVNGPIFLSGWRHTPMKGISFLIGFYGTMVATNIAVVILAGVASQHGDRYRRTLIGLSSIALAAFGVFQIFKSLN